MMKTWKKKCLKMVKTVHTDVGVYLHFRVLPAYGTKTLNRSQDLVLIRGLMKDKLSNTNKTEKMMKSNNNYSFRLGLKILHKNTAT